MSSPPPTQAKRTPTVQQRPAHVRLPEEQLVLHRAQLVPDGPQQRVQGLEPHLPRLELLPDLFFWGRGWGRFVGR